MKNNNKPIGIFDSGLGGLTVLKELKSIMPKERFIYFGDTAHIPYGNKTPKTIQKYCKKITTFLFNQDIKIIVVACNTASSVALETIKQTSLVPVIDVISPAINKITKLSKSKKIGIIGTTATINSNEYQNQIIAQNKNIEIFSCACPLFVPIIEEGLFNHPIAEKTIKHYLDKLCDKNIDTLILGCTHYPIMKEKIKKHINTNITIIDSAKVVAENVKLVLKNKKILNSAPSSNAKDKYYVSDKLMQFNKMANMFLNKQTIINIKHIEL